MMSTFTANVFFAIVILFTLVSAAPLDARDVFVPPVLYPKSGTVWKAGSTHNVSWDISNPPARITNSNGVIVLAKGDRLIGIEHPLASGFHILTGKHEVTIPADTAPGNDYSVVVFGDSGNNSGRFTIIH